MGMNIALLLHYIIAAALLTALPVLAIGLWALVRD